MRQSVQYTGHMSCDKFSILFESSERFELLEIITYFWTIAPFRATLGRFDPDRNLTTGFLRKVSK